MIPGAKVLNATKAIDAAYEHLDIPKLISPQDLTNPNVDELRLANANHNPCLYPRSVMTYVSFFRDAKRKSAVAAPVKADPAPAAEPVQAASSDKPQPWERQASWRNYTVCQSEYYFLPSKYTLPQKPDLGGRLKIRGFYSTTTSNENIRRNTRVLQEILEKKGVHKRPDFVA